ncbi:hypothetical protein Tco_1512297, partial [Tanacetum coccineum]
MDVPVHTPQAEALETTFEARVRDYMAAHTKRMEWFENAIFKQREEINNRMTEMFGLLKELTANQNPKKVLVREYARHLERISKKRTKNEAKTTKPDTEWKSVEKTKSRQSP